MSCTNKNDYVDVWCEIEGYAVLYGAKTEMGIEEDIGTVMWYDSLRWCGLAVREENENDLAKSCMDYEVESVDHWVKAKILDSVYTSGTDI